MTAWLCGRRRLVLTAATVVVAACVGSGVLGERVSWGQAATTQAVDQLKAYGISVGRDTTYLTSPLLADGRVDYAAALNAEGSKGVTPKDNAACLMIRIVPDDRSAIPQDVLRQMGADPSAPRMKWIPIPEGLGTLEEKCSNAPWALADAPKLAEWLDANKAAIDLFVEASRKSAWWVPMRQSGWLLMEGGASPLWSTARSVANAVALRSMQRLGAGDERAAWEDIAACERLGGLMRTSPDTIARLCGAGVASVGVEAEWRLIQYGAVSAQMRQTMDEVLARQRAWPTGQDVVPQSLRYQFLMQVQWIAQAMHEGMDKNGGELRRGFEAAGMKPPDWNAVMRWGNKAYDRLQSDQSRMSAIGRAEFRQSTAQFLKEMRQTHRETRMDEIRMDGTADTSWLLPRVGETQEAYTDRAAMSIFGMTMPRPERTERRFAQCNDATHWTRVALALLRYRQDLGAYPDDLKALVPRYVATLPEANAEAPTQYARKGQGFVLTNDQTGTTATQPTTKPWHIEIRRDR